jgi:hypothetical protein
LPAESLWGPTDTKIVAAAVTSAVPIALIIPILATDTESPGPACLCLSIPVECRASIGIGDASGSGGVLIGCACDVIALPPYGELVVVVVALSDSAFDRTDRRTVADIDIGAPQPDLTCTECPRSQCRNRCRYGHGRARSRGAPE